MEIEVSNGEVIDKLTILNIKSEKIKDQEKLENIHRELHFLRMKSTEWWSYWEKEILPLFDSLLSVNRQLWDIEDKIRELDNEVFLPRLDAAIQSVYRFSKVCEYIECARMVYTLNYQVWNNRRKISFLERFI
jgi:hypothetical protein